MIALLLAAACVCPPAPRQYDWTGVNAALAEASRKTDAQLAAKRERALRQMREEMDAILVRNRAAFERGER